MIANIIKEARHILSEYKKGNTDVYLDTSAFVGEFKTAAEAINKLLRVMSQNSQTKSRFLAHMSHEIRTPITTVLGISEIQLKNPNHPLHTEEAFAKIHSSASNLLCLVNDILDLSKVEAGKMSIIEQKYKLADIIMDVAQLQLVYMGNKPVDFQISADENLPTHLFGDEMRIKQVINNLLSNAFKYTDRGSVVLSLKNKKGSEDGFILLEISIKDTGRGMTKEQLDDLYNEYSRYNEKSDRTISGIGLGMPIVYNLVKLMGATIDVKSKIGKGTVAVVQLPQLVASKNTLGPQFGSKLSHADIMSHSRRSNFTPKPMPHGDVLVVDDIEANLYVMEGFLRFYEINVETCESGACAIDKVQKGKTYDIIFMDYMMPKLDGIETVKILRDMGYARPIVALTANALIGQAEEFFKNGFDGFISKPVQGIHLDAILNKFIRDKYPQAKSEEADSYLNSPELMAAIHIDFVKGQKDIMPDIHAAVQSGDFKTAHRLAHNLKGLAGLIGEDKLSKIAAIIEARFRKGHNASANDMALLKNELDRVIECLTPKEALKAPTAPLKEMTDEVKIEARKLIKKLEPLLEERNVGCLDYLDNLKSLPGTEKVVGQIENFDFKIAVGTLREWGEEFVW